MIINKNVLFHIVNNQVIDSIVSSSGIFYEDHLGQWDSINNPDVYKEKWFHGKISRDEVSRYTFMKLTDSKLLVILG